MNEAEMRRERKKMAEYDVSEEKNDLEEIPFSLFLCLRPARRKNE